MGLTEIIWIAVPLGIAILVLGGGKTTSAPKTSAINPKHFKHYEARPSLFVNRSEAQLYSILYRSLPPHLHLMSKVRLEDVVKVSSALERKDSYSLRGRIKSRHVDFLLIRPDGTPAAAIELDGKSHGASTRNADALKNGIFQAVGIPLYRIRVGENFAVRTAAILADLKPH